MNKSILTVESITYAIKARKLLSAQGIGSAPIKTDGKGGCTHGIEIDPSDLLAAARILRAHGIKYRVRSSDDIS